ncbi:MAG: Crp/Fnr family transcriptional regulator [Bacteroidetes bacterium]|nr:Crp/Fnr family transcriptional regulator [Bacteroidota bacterium]
MDEYEVFKQHIVKRVALTPEEMTELLGGFRLKKVKKKQFIIQPDFKAMHRNYVVQGAFRSYVIGQDGGDHTIQFAIDDWWISDYNSYTYQRPATMFVVALEDSTLLQIDYETEQRLKAQYHKIETFFRIGAERTAAYHQRRIISALTQTAEERYDAFLEAYPSAAQRLPQYAVASYLGMTTQFLSQIRKKRLGKKLN